MRINNKLEKPGSISKASVKIWWSLLDILDNKDLDYNITNKS